MKIPDQDLFEPDPVLEQQEPTLKDEFRKLLILFGAAAALVGMLYLGGVYQFFLFGTTSERAIQEALSSIVDGPEITLPLRVFVLTGGETLGSSREEDDVYRLIENASALWAQAHIILVIESITFVSVPESELGFFLADPHGFVRRLRGIDFGSLNIILTKTLSGLNGVAFTDIESAVVADYTTSFDFRVLAHEVGHLLGLSHEDTDRRRLMFQGAEGIQLTAEEAAVARERALQLQKPGESIR